MTPIFAEYTFYFIVSRWDFAFSIIYSGESESKLCPIGEYLYFSIYFFRESVTLLPTSGFSSVDRILATFLYCAA